MDTRWRNRLSCLFLESLLMVDAVSTVSDNVTDITHITDDNADDDSGEWTLLTKSVVSLLGLGLCIITAVVASRLVDKCHDMLSLRDDASDMSEHTRDLLKIKYATKFFSRNRQDKDARTRAFEAASKLGRVWLVKARLSRRQRLNAAVIEDVRIPVPEIGLKVESPAPEAGTDLEKESETASSNSHVIQINSETKQSRTAEAIIEEPNSIDKKDSEDLEQVKSITEQQCGEQIVGNLDGKIEYREISEDATISTKENIPKTRTILQVQPQLNDSETNNYSSNGNLCELNMDISEYNINPKDNVKKVNSAWVSRENTAAELLNVELSTTPSHFGENMRLKSYTMENIRLENVTPMPEQSQNSPKLNERASEENQKRPSSSKSTSGRKTPRPLTAKFSSVITPGGRHSQTPRSSTNLTPTPCVSTPRSSIHLTPTSAGKTSGKVAKVKSAAKSRTTRVTNSKVKRK